MQEVLSDPRALRAHHPGFQKSMIGAAGFALGLFLGASLFATQQSRTSPSVRLESSTAVGALQTSTEPTLSPPSRAVAAGAAVSRIEVPEGFDTAAEAGYETHAPDQITMSGMGP